MNLLSNANKLKPALVQEASNQNIPIEQVGKAVRLEAEEQRISRAEASLRVERYLKWKSKAEHGDLKLSDTALEWLSQFYSEGYTSVLFGHKNTGKSNFTSVSAEMAILSKPDIDFITNVPFIWQYDMGDLPALEPKSKDLGRIVPVFTFVDMLEKIADSLIARRVPVVGIDEADGALLSKEMMSIAASNWYRFDQIDRHLHCQGPMLIYHDVRNIPPYLRDTNPDLIYWIKQFNQKRYVSNPYVQNQLGMLKIWASNLLYTQGVRTLEIEEWFDMKDMAGEISGMGRDLAKRIKRYIISKRAEQREKLVPEDERIKKALDICELSKTGKSTTQIATSLNLSQSTVGWHTKKFCPTRNSKVYRN